MTKKTQPPYLTIWEQWLQRLSGSYAIEIRDDINRFELIELLATPSETDNILCSRLGTVFNHFFPVELIAIYDLDTQELVFSTIPRSEEKRISQKVLPIVINRKSDGEMKIRLSLNLRGKSTQLHYLYQLYVSSPACRFAINFLSSTSLENRERRFLEAVQALLNLRLKTAQSTKNLSTQNDRLKAVTQHLSEGLMILNDNLIVENWNRPMQHITGFSPVEGIGKHYRQVFYRTDAPDWLRSLLEEQGKSGTSRVFRQEFQIKTSNNKQKWVNISGSVLLGEDGQLEQIICIIRDVSKFKELELRKSEFISIATHELRTPITAVKGYLSLIEKNKDELTEKQQNYLKQATIASERLVKLAEDLLQVVHVEEEQLKFTIQPIDITPILQKVYQDFSVKAARKGLKIFFENNTKSQQIIAADPVRFEQIFANLFDNAIKYTSIGQVTLRVNAGKDRGTQEDQVTIEIIDTGNGINGRDLETIFNKFRRTDSAHRSRESGAGLGLFIVKSFVEKQNGKITVISRIRKGSTFAVTFPIIKKKIRRRKK